MNVFPQQKRPDPKDFPFLVIMIPPVKISLEKTHAVKTHNPIK